MIPGMNPRAMKQAMKRMGIKQEEIDATEVIIKSSDKEIVITNPQVSKVNMMGQETYQVVGEAVEREIDSSPTISPEDIQTVMDSAKCTADEAKAAIQEHNFDLASAIMSFSK